MAVAALIKFVQGGLTPPAGQSLIGTAGTLVTASNGNNSNVNKWEWEWFAVPTVSATTVGIFASGNVPSISFTPDVAGTYVLLERVYDQLGNVSQDMRCFAVLEASGRLIPNFGADAPALNFSGQLKGWHPYLEAWLKRIDTLGAGTSPMAALAIDWTLAGAYTKTLAAGANAITFTNAVDGQIILVALTGAASTVSWPAGTQWTGGVAPTQTASGKDVYTFAKIGASIIGSVVPNVS